MYSPMVSILVLVDLAHEFFIKFYQIFKGRVVSILVLVDLAHECNPRKSKCISNLVSILVLVDLAHEFLQKSTS